MVTIILFTLFIVPLTFVVSLALAMMVNGVGRGTGFFRTVFFIPTAVSYVVASLIWRMGIFNGLPSGFANWLLYTLGEQPGLPFGWGHFLIEFFGGNRVVWIGTPSAVVLAGPGDGTTLVAGWLLYDHLPCRPAGDSTQPV